MTVRVLLYEGDGATPLTPERRSQLFTALLDRGVPVTRAVAGGRVRPPADGEVHIVLGDFDDPPAEDPPTLYVRPLHRRAVAEVVGEIGSIATARQGADPNAWKPWFPVIDYDRCTNCMQCLSFCLFGVYGVNDGKIQVQHERRCKTDCPACSRVCPEAAIMFPKYRKGAISGDEVKPSDVEREAMKADISALLGGDVYGALRARSADARKRFATDRDPSKALLERRRCLTELGMASEIPPEVLMSLPSSGDIEERARRAREKDELRRARSRTVADQRPLTPEDWDLG